ncbi:translation factor SUI1-like protein [Drosera capensis]
MSELDIQIPTTFDPFAEANAEDSGAGPKDYVHIRIQQRNGRKSLTTVQGLKKDFSYSKILKDLKKEFCCNGTVVQDPELGQVIQLQGDQRKNVASFLAQTGSSGHCEEGPNQDTRFLSSAEVVACGLLACNFCFCFKSWSLLACLMFGEPWIPSCLQPPLCGIAQCLRKYASVHCSKFLLWLDWLVIIVQEETLVFVIPDQDQSLAFSRYSSVQLHTRTNLWSCSGYAFGSTVEFLFLGRHSEHHISYLLQCGDTGK